MYTMRDVIEELIRMDKEITSNGESDEKVYFSGEFDSSQTEFEEKSNHLEIGVLARSAIIGKACLRLVRYIIDKHSDKLFEIDIHNTFRHFECDQPGIKRLVYYLAYTEEQYMNCFNPNDKFTVTLYKWNSQHIIQTTISEVDIWTINRIKHY